MRNKRLKVIAWILAVAMFMTAIPGGNVYAEESTAASEVSAEAQEEVLEVQEKIPATLNYLYINEAEQEAGAEQNIVVSWGDGTEEIRDIKLELENDKGEKQSISSIYDVDGVFLFSDFFEKGVYHVTNFTIVTKTAEKTFSMDELGVNAYFSVGKECSDEKKSEHLEMDSIATDEIETQVVTIDDEGVATAQDSIADALEEISSNEVSSHSTSRAVSKEKVVALDPGHDSQHVGARGNDVKEEVATLKIAKYCKAELETYDGVTVLMTRDTATCPFPTSTSNLDDIRKRVQWAVEKGANIFVSIHLNSATVTSAKGAEVYYAASDKNGKNLAQKIQDELVKIGLSDRGIKSGDVYTVIDASKKNGIPGLIVEHAFLSNKSDADKYLKKESGLKKLGVADATGIATYLKLKKKSAVPITELDTPVLKSIVQDEGAVTVNWGKVTNASGYYIYRKQGEEPWAQIAKVTSGKTTSYTDKTVPEGEIYSYTVKAYHESVNSNYDENGLSIFALDQPVVTSAVYDGTSITVQWESVENAEKYYIYRKTNDGKWSCIGNVDQETFSYKDSTMAAGNRYAYTVRAFSASNYSSCCEGKEVISFTKPKLVSAKYDAGQVTVKWKKVTGAEGYRVYRKEEGGSWKQIGKVTSGSKVTYADNKIEARKKYVYMVRAYKGDCVSGYEKEGVSVTTPKKLYITYKTKTNLNYRTGPGKSYKIAGTLKKNKKVQVVSGYSKKANGMTWYKIKINSKFYYVSSKYLKKV